MKTILITALFGLSCSLAAGEVDVIDVAPVWSGHPVDFCLLTHKSHQFVAFYDAERTMTVASRVLPGTSWTLQKLPSKLGWDSHNYVTMALDDDGYIHLSGNMHGVPLVYFRSQKPLDVTTLVREQRMVGPRENRVTYPTFMRGANNQLLFTYRDGGSGNGAQIFNKYDSKTRTWGRLIDEPLTDGLGRMNAYMIGPSKGPDGFYHLIWVWRNSPDCSTNHDLSYARSRDLVNWETSTGSQLRLPMVLETADIVDPVPVKGGMINGNTVLGFDSEKRPVISYHKFDRNGKTQFFQARLENGKWNVVQTTDWDYRWDFSGGGTMIFKIGLSPLRTGAKGELIQSYTYPGHGGTYVLDDRTLKIIRKEEPPRPAVTPAKTPEVRDGMGVITTGDRGSGNPGETFILRWETLPSNQDRPREGPPPEPSMLQVIRTAP